MPEVGQIWEHVWNGDVTYHLMLEAVDVSRFRMTENRPEPGFWILSLDRGDTTYLCCDQLDEDIWRRLT